MSEVMVKNLVKDFGKDTHVLKGLDLTIRDGSFTVLLGPSGCGKSTLLRIVAGLESPTSGQVLINGQDVTRAEPCDRDLAMVFQNYALYPHMTVFQNVEYGLKLRKMPKGERTAVVEQALELVDLADQAKKRPAEMSGGQRQRVALARAIVKRPGVYLMDEPLSNLDAKLRGQMREKITELYHQLGATFLYVTHDQVEAMSMADRIVLMDKGRIQQQASPETLYRDPENVFAAQFVGTPPMNILLMRNGKRLGFRPESVQLASEPSEDPFCRAGEIVTREMLGSETLYKLRMGTDTIMIKSGDDSYRMGDKLFALVPASKLFFFNEDGQRIRSGSGADMNALIRTVRGENLD